MTDIIIGLEEFDTWKIQLKIAINFISSKHVEEERVMHAKSNNIEFMLCDITNKVVDKLFGTFLSRYQCSFETSMRRRGFIFYSVHLLYYKRHKITFGRVDSYIDSPDRMKKEKSNNESEKER